MTRYTTLATAALVAFSSLAFAGSEVKKSAIVNQANIQGAANIAAGRNAEANMGTVKIEGSKIEKSAIVNQANIQGAANIAAGRDAEANMGSVVIK